MERRELIPTVRSLEQLNFNGSSRISRAILTHKPKIHRVLVNKECVYGVVYIARNTVNGHCYAGKTTSLKDRIRSHILDSRWSDYPFYRAIRKYGITSFEFIIVASATTKEELKLLERKAIDKFGYYNVVARGACSPYSKEWRGKISTINKGIKKHTESYKANLSIVMSGDRNPMKRPEVRLKSSIAHLGKKFSEVTIGRMIVSRKGKIRGTYGKKKISTNS